MLSICNIENKLINLGLNDFSNRIPKSIIPTHSSIKLNLNSFNSVENLEEYINIHFKILLSFFSNEYIRSKLHYFERIHDTFFLLINIEELFLEKNLIMRNIPDKSELFYTIPIKENNISSDGSISNNLEDNIFQFNHSDVKAFFLSLHRVHPRYYYFDSFQSFKENCLYLNMLDFYTWFLPNYSTSLPVKVAIKKSEFNFRKIFKNNSPINFLTFVSQDNTFFYFNFTQDRELDYLIFKDHYPFLITL